MEVVGGVHVHEDGEILHIHLGLVVGMTPKEAPQIVSGVGLRQSLSIAPGEQRRVAAQSAAGWMYHAVLAAAEALDQTAEDLGSHQGIVGREDEERLHIVAQCPHPGLYGREHPRLVAGVVHRADRESAEDRRERVRIVSGHHHDVADAGLGDGADHTFYHRRGAQGQ